MYRARYEVIRQLRKQRGWAQETLAELASLSYRTIQNMESKREFDKGRVFKEPMFEALAHKDVFDVLMGDLGHFPMQNMSPSLDKLLESVRARGKERDCRVHTPQLLQAMLQPGRALHAAIDAHGDVAYVQRKIDHTVDYIEPRSEPFEEFDWEQRNYVKRARQYAWMKLRDAIDADLALAVFQIGLFEGKGSQIVQRIRKWLGDPTLANVVQFLRIYEPPDPNGGTPPVPSDGSTLG